MSDTTKVLKNAAGAEDGFIQQLDILAEGFFRAGQPCSWSEWIGLGKKQKASLIKASHKVWAERAALASNPEAALQEWAQTLSQEERERIGADLMMGRFRFPPDLLARYKR